jgi:hypothetical protein
MAISPLSLAFLILLVLLPTVAGMAWVTWIAMGRMGSLASRGLTMAEEVQRHLWSAELSKNPDRAQMAGHLEVVAKPDYGEIMERTRSKTAKASNEELYPDEAALMRQ